MMKRLLIVFLTVLLGPAADIMAAEKDSSDKKTSTYSKKMTKQQIKTSEKSAGDKALKVYSKKMTSEQRKASEDVTTDKKVRVYSKKMTKEELRASEYSLPQEEPNKRER